MTLHAAISLSHKGMHWRAICKLAAVDKKLASNRAKFSLRLLTSGVTVFNMSKRKAASSSKGSSSNKRTKKEKKDESEPSPLTIECPAGQFWLHFH